MLTKKFWLKQRMGLGSVSNNKKFEFGKTPIELAQNEEKEENDANSMEVVVDRVEPIDMAAIVELTDKINPYLDEMYLAEKGKGAFLNGKSIKVSNKKLTSFCEKP